MIQPMLCKSITKIPEGSEWVLEKKLDGWRCLAYIQDHGCKLFTRTGKAITSVPYINKELLELFPMGTILDGEIVSTTDTEWNQVQEVCSRDRQHVISDGNPALKFVIFDAIRLDGIDLTNETLAIRRESLDKINEFKTKNVQVIEQLESTQANYDKIVEAGGEGAVIKAVSSTYSPGSRGWNKIKHTQEIEAVCTGTYSTDEGTKYAGNAVGGITFKWTYDGKPLEGKCAGNINDKLRKELFEKPDGFVGKVVEIKHYGINETGKLRMPQFLRFRDEADKAAPTPVAKPVKAVKAKPGAKRIRNYAAMGDAKLHRCYRELKNGGDAAERSDDPARDLAIVEGLILEVGDAE